MKTFSFQRLALARVLCSIEGKDWDSRKEGYKADAEEIIKRMEERNYHLYNSNVHQIEQIDSGVIELIQHNPKDYQ